MPDETAGERSLPASPMKKQRAREKGNVAKSQDLNAAWTLMFSLIAMLALGGAIFESLAASTYHFFDNPELYLAEPESAQALAARVLIRLGRTTLPFMLLMLVAGVSINVMQVGFLFAPQVLIPKLEKLNPVTGFKKFVSLRSFVELVKSVTKLTFVGYIVWLSLRDRLPEILLLMQQSPWEIITTIAMLIVAVWWRVVLAMIGIGILDFAFQRWHHERDLRMTVQEARQEAKEFEGDPRIKRRVRQIQRQLAMQRMMAAVPEAEVVITNPTTFAVALRYQADAMDAPVVVAKGARRLAERILEIAVEHRVPVVEKPELARTLYHTLDVGQPVPESVFKAIAEVLAYVYQIDQRETKRRERAHLTPLRQAV